MWKGPLITLTPGWISEPSTRKCDGETAINDVPRVRQTETKLSPRFSLELVKGIPGDGAPVSKQVTPAWVLSLWYKPPQIGLSRKQAILKDMLGWRNRILGSPWSTKACVECKWFSPNRIGQDWRGTTSIWKVVSLSFLHCMGISVVPTAFNWEFASRQ